MSAGCLTEFYDLILVVGYRSLLYYDVGYDSDLTLVMGGRYAARWIVIYCWALLRVDKSVILLVRLFLHEAPC